MSRRRWLLISLVGLALPLLLLAGGVHWTSSPSYCRTCHQIEPYYESWSVSTHADVSCGKCHWDSGLKGTLQAKLDALDELVQHLRGHSTLLRAQIPDQRCLNCHAVPAERLTYLGVPFEHFQHLSLTSAGLQMNCTACHYQPDEPSAFTHIPAPPDPCYQCHLGEHTFPRLRDCMSCHEASLRQRPANDRFSHAPILAESIPCENCHEDLTEGQGKVAPSVCGGCHTQDVVDEMQWDTVDLHRKHLHGRGQTACENCHARIDHSFD